MGLFSFFNLPKPRKFDHKPIFYDPRKEALEERIQKAKKELGIEIPDSEFKPHIKGAITGQSKHLIKRRSNPQKSSPIRTIWLAVLLVLLLIVAYYLYFKR